MSDLVALNVTPVLPPRNGKGGLGQTVDTRFAVVISYPSHIRLLNARSCYVADEEFLN